MAEEKYVVVDENDNVIGAKPRGMLLATDIYRVSGLWMTSSNGDILLAQRALTKHQNPGAWGPAVAGTVEEGETYEDNIIKETAEEIGLTGLSLTKGPKQHFQGQYHCFCQWFTATSDKDAADFTIQASEVAQVRWIGRADLVADVRDYPEKYITGFDWALENLLLKT